VVPTTAVLIKVGLHDPVMPFREIKGREGAEAFWQRGPICANVGVIPPAVITISMVAVVAHCPEFGVNV